jgi:uncharacterized protein (TIGR03086 family)
VNEAEVFVLADRTLAGVVTCIRNDQWDMTMPATFAMRNGAGAPTLRDIINYHAYDDAWVPDMLAGRTMGEAGPSQFDGDLLGEDPVENFEAIADRACAAAAAVEDFDAVAHLSFGDYTVREYFWQINSFRALRSHDLAAVIGVDAGLPAELVQGVWDEVSPHAEEWRSIGVFPPAVPVPEDAPLLDRLLGVTGRPPDA